MSVTDISIIRVLLAGQLMEERGSVPGNVAWLHRQICASEAAQDFFSADADEGSEPISYDAVRRIIWGIHPVPDSAIAVAVAFLDQHGVLDHQLWKRYETFPFSNRPPGLHASPRSSRNIDPLIRGGFLEFASTNNFTVSYFLHIWEVSQQPFVRAYAIDREYEHDDLRREADRAFQARIDKGQCDQRNEFGGYLNDAFGDVGIRLRRYERTRIWASGIKGTLIVNGRDGGIDALEFRANVLTREYQHLFTDDSKNHKILTSREISNSVGSRRRFFDEITFEKRITWNVTTLSAADRDLLAAAKISNPIDMIKALMDGANPNAQDAESGMTALHYAGQTLNPFAVCVIVHDEDYQKKLLEAVSAEPDLDEQKAERALRMAQASSDPLILDKQNRFPSECCGAQLEILPSDAQADVGKKASEEDPIHAVRSMVADGLMGVEYWAMEERGLPPLNEPGMFTLEERLAYLKQPHLKTPDGSTLG